MRLPIALCILALGGLGLTAQTLPVPDPEEIKPSKPAPSPASAKATSTINALQASVDRLTQNNQALLDLLKKQQAVLEDIQFDRRLQSRQIQSVAQRLEQTLAENAKLQAKVAAMEATAAATPAPAPAAAVATNASPAKPPPVVEPPPAEPSTYLPPEPAPTPQGTPGWHRAFTLSGTESKTTDIFNVQGGTWRVVWHNLDKPGKAYVNTSALFINAFPRDDTIPQKVCSKLGPGGDSTILIGPGHYYLKIEASGGSWELAVEDFY